jgi:hypothetical protein
MCQFKNSKLYDKVIEWHIDNKEFEKVYMQQFSLSKKEAYFYEAFLLLLSIDSAFDDLELNGKFISQYHNKDLLDIQAVGRNAYLKYHLEYFYLEISTIYDLSLKLINAICKLNLNGMQINYSNIIKCEFISEKVKSFVTEFDLEIKNIKSIRNSITHSNKFDDKNIELLMLIEFAKQNSQNEIILKLINDSGDFINQQSYSKIIEFTTATKQITYEYITNLYNHLDDPFLENLS